MISLVPKEYNVLVQNECIVIRIMCMLSFNMQSRTLLLLN